MFSEDEKQRFKCSLGSISKYHEKVKNIKLLGHRGMGPSLNVESGSTLVENTISSFKEAIILGADGLEFDVISSKDSHIMVIHSDKLWLHVNDLPRDGSILPANESKDSFRVSQKTFKQLKQLSLSEKQEKIPSLFEVLILVTDSNKMRKEYGLDPLILNIEIKSSKRLDLKLENSCTKLLTTITNYLRNELDCLINFNNIYFCSFEHRALELLIDNAKNLKLAIQVAPIIKTVNLFGAEQVNPDHSLITGAKYNEAALSCLKNDLFNNFETQFKAYDIILWDLYLPLIEIVQTREKELHTSTSEYSTYDIPSTFGVFLLKMSDRVPVKFKCDDTQKAMELLTYKARLLDQYKNNKKFLKEQHDSLESQTSKSSSVLLNYLPRPN